MRVSVALRLLGFLAIAVGLGSCAHPVARRPAQEAAAGPLCTRPDSKPCTQQDWVDYINAQKDWLPVDAPTIWTPYEQFAGGSWESERNGFVGDMASVFMVQQDLMSDHHGIDGNPSGAGRVFHYKQHGCLVGHMTLLQPKQRSGDKKGLTNRSFLSTNGSTVGYTVMARFSNGMGMSKSDTSLDVRGMALKIFGVIDNADKQEHVVDFNMTNSKTAFGRNQHDFVEFMQTQAESMINGEDFKTFVESLVSGARKQGAFAVNHPAVVAALVKATDPFTADRSLIAQQYWSGHPYLFPAPQGNFTAIKLTLEPNPLDRLLPPHSVPVEDQLRRDLAYQAAHKTITYTLAIQLFDPKHPDQTPIEDDSKEWSTPFIPVATITFPEQVLYSPDSDEFTNANSGQQKAAEEVWASCQNARFTPGHFVSQDRPLSNMGRGRIYTYTASAKGRDAESPNVVQTLGKDQVRALPLEADQVVNWQNSIRIQ